MFSIALIGADGAGKTTIGRRLEHQLPLPVKYIYMGNNLEASNHMLPTTRLIRAIKRWRGRPSDGGPPDPARRKPVPAGAIKRTLVTLKSILRLTNQLAEEWYRQMLAWFYQRRGYIVIFDRHYFHDYYAHDIVGQEPHRSFVRRLHGYILEHIYPKPDLVICLDAPAALLHARKPEGSLEAIERRRQEYLQMQKLVDTFVLIDASRSEDQVTQDVIRAIEVFYATQRKSPSRARSHVAR